MLFDFILKRMHDTVAAIKEAVITAPFLSSPFSLYLSLLPHLPSTYGFNLLLH